MIYDPNRHHTSLPRGVRTIGVYKLPCNLLQKNGPGSREKWVRTYTHEAPVADSLHAQSHWPANSNLQTADHHTALPFFPREKAYVIPLAKCMRVGFVLQAAFASSAKTIRYALSANSYSSWPSAAMAPVETMQVKRLSENAIMPVRGSEHAAGFDLARCVLINEGEPRC